MVRKNQNLSFFLFVGNQISVKVYGKECKHQITGKKFDFISVERLFSMLLSDPTWFRTFLGMELSSAHSNLLFNKCHFTT
jgi:hypothetical protein